MVLSVLLRVIPRKWISCLNRKKKQGVFVMLEQSAIQFKPKSNLIIPSRWVTYNVIGLSLFIIVTSPNLVDRFGSTY